MATKAKATETKEFKPMTPKELAAELDIDPKRLRAFLRGNEATMRPLEAKNTSWQLDEATIALVRERFTSNDDSEGNEE